MLSQVNRETLVIPQEMQRSRMQGFGIQNGTTFDPHETGSHVRLFFIFPSVSASSKRLPLFFKFSICAWNLNCSDLNKRLATLPRSGLLGWQMWMSKWIRKYRTRLEIGTAWNNICTSSLEASSDVALNRSSLWVQISLKYRQVDPCNHSKWQYLQRSLFLLFFAFAFRPGSEGWSETLTFSCFKKY